jgi:hypothetical protein
MSYTSTHTQNAAQQLADDFQPQLIGHQLKTNFSLFYLFATSSFNPLTAIFYTFNLFKPNSTSLGSH